MGITHDLDRNVRDKMFFDLWVELGTQRRVALFLKNEKKIINPKSGKSYSHVAVKNFAYNWVCNHPDEARPVYEKELGEPISDKEWELFILEKAIMVKKTSRVRFVNWAKRVGYYDKYFDKFKDKFGLTEEDR